MQYANIRLLIAAPGGKENTWAYICNLAVLSSLVAVVPDKLANGRIVRIGDLGDFRPSINSKGHDNEKEVTPASIKKSKVVFRAGKRIKNVIKVAENL